MIAGQHGPVEVVVVVVVVVEVVALLELQQVRTRSAVALRRSQDSPEISLPLDFSTVRRTQSFMPMMF